MNRSPIAYPLRRGPDGGGDAELQTDVMRFMAILSLCLVAIFALVQSIPNPPPKSPPEPVESAEVETTPTPPAPEPVVLTRPPRPQLTTPEPAPLLQRPPPSRQTAVERPAPETVSSPTKVPDQPKGFSLRFESDDALLRLVAREAITFYALRDGSAKRMQVEMNRVSFWPSSTPAQFHEMDASTVPADVVAALGRDAHRVSWGVALPNTMSERLTRILNQRDGGDIVIGADGQMRVL